MKIVWVGLVFLLVSCKYFSSNQNQNNLDAWPGFDAQQHRTLTTLQQQSSTAVLAQPWPTAGTLMHVEMQIPQVGTPLEATKKFLQEHAVLWHLSEELIANNIVITPLELTPCASVLVSMKQNEVPVFNATLQFNFEKAHLKSITGLMDGSHVAIAKAATLSQAEAAKTIQEHFDWPEEAAVPVEQTKKVIFDPHFSNGTSGTAVESWVYGASQTGVIVNGETGSVEVSTPGAPDTNVVSTLDVCGDSTRWLPQVAVDRAVGTPAMVSFEHLGGFALEPGPIETAVVKALKAEPLLKMYGDLNPEDHLVVRKQITRNQMTTVFFNQNFGGFRVEGAYLQATVQNGRLQRIFSRLPYFPVFVEPIVTELVAEPLAVSWYLDKQCGVPKLASSGTQTPCRTELSTVIKSRETIVFVPEIFGEAAIKKTHLAYRLEFERGTLWWSASENRFLRFDSNVHSVVPFRVWSFSGVPPICPPKNFFGESGCPTKPIDELRAPFYDLDFELDGGRVEPPMHPDSPKIPGWMATIDQKMIQLFEWNGILGDGGVSNTTANTHLEVIVGFPADQARASIIDPRTFNLQQTLAIELGLRVTAPDVLAHEYVHHVTQAAYVPLSKLEQGALAEHYSDILALTIFPNSNWNLAQSSPGGSVRNLLHPDSPNTPSGNSAIAHYAQRSRCDSNLTDCTYEWLGIPNRAFALIASGVPNAVVGTTPLGLEKAAQLYFETIRPGPFQMQSSDRFANQRLKILAACARLHSLNDCVNVERAFDEVGIEATLFSGFSRFAERYSVAAGTYDLRIGSRLYNGCKISNHTMQVEVRGSPDGVAITAHQIGRTTTDTPPLLVRVTAVNEHQGEISKEVLAAVLERCGDTNIAQCAMPTNRHIKFRVESDWLGQPTNAWVDETIFTPPGVTLAQCESPIPFPGSGSQQLLWSTPIEFAAANRRDIVFDPNRSTGTFVPAQCKLLEIGVIDSHQSGAMPDPKIAPVGQFNHGAHGVSLIRSTTDPKDYAATLHLWAEFGSGVFGRIVYRAAKPPNVNCVIPGTTVVP
jgi:Thermolysin metallopeptidase, alpha-helical domain